MSKRVLQKKICMLGMFGVGKTSLVKRYVYDRFDDSYLSTIGVKVYEKLLPPQESDQGGFVQYDFLIWDIEGIEDESKPTTSYLIGSAGALVVADLTREDTITAIPSIVRMLASQAPSCAVLVAANKADLVKEESANETRLTETASDLDIPCILTSAKTGRNVEAGFQKLGLLLAKL